jgi:DNA repair exonuclease SbcCD ATPase subunit
MRAIAIAVLLSFAVPAFPQQPPAPQPELERVERTLQTLSELKSKIAEISSQIDQLTAELSEQKGAIQNRKPAAFGGSGEVNAGPADRAKSKTARCAAITAKGERCTRPSVAGSRYCRQHQMAHQ